MAELDRRAKVGDPLALNPNAQAADRSLSLTMVRNPGQTGGDSVYRDQMAVVDSLNNLATTVGAVVDRKKDDWMTEGKLRYMQGATEAEIQATGNKYTMQGWQSLNAVDAANRWYAEEVALLENGANQMSPEDYNQSLMKKRAAFFDNLPDDPAVRKIWVAAFDDLGTRLASAHVGAHNAYNTQKYEENFTNVLSSGSYANSDASSTVSGSSPIRLSPGKVRPVVSNYTDRDVDILTRTMLGEAAGEGSTGLAAVAHVVLNRAIDGGYGGTSLSAVALAPKQFSAWNSGAGGNNPSKWDPNSSTYQQARAIALDVLSGHHVDPTNGATHYYSPRGMQKLVADGDQKNLLPRWLESERQKSGGEITIGGHIFVGKARGWNQQVQATTQTPVQMSTAPGANIPAVPDPNNPNGPGVVPVKPDTSSTGQTIISTAPGANVPGVPDPNNPSGPGIVPNKPSPSVELEVSEDTPAVAVAEAQGIPTVETQSPPQTQVQEFIRKASMPNSRKAVILGNQMINQLMMGDDQLFHDAGGIGMLTELGADPALIRQVYSAKEAYDGKKQNEFNLERVQQHNIMQEQVRNGQITLDDALAEVQRQYDDKSIDGTKATQLVNQLMAEDEALRAAGNSNPQLRRELTNIYRGVQAGDYDAVEAQGMVEDMALEYDMPVSQVQAWINRMWDAEQTTYNSQVTALRKAEEDRLKDDAIYKQVDYYISAGAGLGTMSGSLSNGTSVKDYAVGKIRERAADAGNAALAEYEAAGMDSAEAQAKAASVAQEQFHTTLMQQDLVDTQLQAAFTGASRGAVVTNGVVNPGTMAAFDDYLQMVQNPNIGAAYASKYLQHDDGRDLFTLAAQLYAGDNDIERALLAAHDYLRGGQGRRAEDVALSSTELDRELNKALDNHFNTYLNSGQIPDGDARYARDNVGDFSNIVRSRATAYAINKPFVPMSVHVQKAAEDVMNDTYLVGGNFVYTDTRNDPEKSLLNVMGLQGRGKDAPHEAVAMFLRENLQEKADHWKATGEDADGWGRAWAEREQDLGQHGLSIAGAPPGASVLAGRNLPPDTPPFYTQYDPTTGNFMVWLWDDASRKDTVPGLGVYVVPAAEAGALYAERNKAAENPLEAGANFFVDLIESMGSR